MWLHKELRKLPTFYLLLFFFIATQVFAFQRFFQNNDAYLKYRKDSRALAFYLNVQYAGSIQPYLNKKENADSFTKNMEIWAENAMEVWLYVRDCQRERYYGSSDPYLTEYPLNDDLGILLNLSYLYGFDYAGAGSSVPRPEAILGEKKWEALRQYYAAIGTPESIRERLLPPFQNDTEHSDVPVLRPFDAKQYYFYIQSFQNGAARLLSSFPHIGYYNAAAPILIHQFLGNRNLLIIFFVFCSVLLSTRVSEDRQLGSIRLLTAMPRGRLRYFLSSYGNALCIGTGALFAAIIPSVLLSIFKFGLKGFDYPGFIMSQSYRSLNPLPIMQGNLIYSDVGTYSRSKMLAFDPSSIEDIYSPMESWKFLLIILGFLCLIISLVLLLNFIVSTLSKSKTLTLSISVILIVLSSISLYDNTFCAKSFPYNPFAAIDVVTTAGGYQKFTTLSALLTLLGWNLIAFLCALWFIQKKNLD